MFDKFSVSFHCNIKIINLKYKHVKINKILILDVMFMTELFSIALVNCSI